MSGSSTVLHLAFDLFDLDEVRRIEGKRRIVAVALVGAKTTIGDALAPCIHCRRVPEFGKIPVVVAEIRDRVQDLATRYGALIVNDRACGARPALKLGTSLESSPCDQLVHV